MLRHLLVGIAVVTSVSLTQAATLSPIIEASDLNALVQQQAVKIVDIRGDVKAFAQAHITGSVQIPYGKFRGPAENPGKLPELTQLAAIFGAAGLDLSDSVVVAHEGKNSSDFGAAARVYWTLKSVGFENLAVLNGGVKAYQSAGFAMASGVPQVLATSPTLVFNNQWYASTADVQAETQNSGTRLLDGRPADFFNGKAWHRAASKPGALPGADNFAFDAFFAPKSPLLKAQGEVVEIVKANGLDTANTISYCNTGHWAATNWFVLSEVAQVPDVKLYAESIVAWSNTDSRMDNVPSAIQFAVLKTKKWFNELAN